MLHRSARWGSVLAPLFWLVSSDAAAATRVALPFDSGEAWSWTDEHFSVDLILTRRHAQLVEQWSGLKENPGKLPLAYTAERAQKGEPAKLSQFPVDVALFNVGGEFFATQDQCTHGQWSVRLDQDDVLHDFDILATGADSP